MWQTLLTANIKGIGKTITLGQALFSFLRYKFFDLMLVLCVFNWDKMCVTGRMWVIANAMSMKVLTVGCSEGKVAAWDAGLRGQLGVPK